MRPPGSAWPTICAAPASSAPAARERHLSQIASSIRLSAALRCTPSGSTGCHRVSRGRAVPGRSQPRTSHTAEAEAVEREAHARDRVDRPRRDDRQPIAGRERLVAAHGEGGRLDPIGEVHRADRIVLGPFCDGDYNARPGGLLPDGSLLVRCEQRLFGRVRGEYRQIVGLLRERRSGAVDTIGWFPADSGRTDRRGVPVPRPYVPRSPLLWTAAADRIFVASADDPRVQLFTREAVQGGGFTVPAKPQAVTARHIEEDRAEALRPVRTDNDRRVVLEWMEGSPRAARTPALRTLLAVSREELWIETWVRSAAGSHWLVVNGSGDPLAQVRLPVGITLLAAGGDWVMGLWRDPYGVERVRLYRLTRT